MPKFTNTFSGGLDRDTVPTSYKSNNYYYAKNFSIIVAEDLSSATLTNTKGVTFKVVDYNANSSRSIVGLCEIDDSMVIFIKGNGTNGRIHKVPFSVLEAVTDTPINLNDGAYLLVSNSFNFSDRVEIVAREETSTIKKIYWVDGDNPFRYCNISLGATVLSGYSLDQFEIYQNVVFSTPIFSRLISGNLKCGMYQYSYCLYNQNANQTSYSPPSGFIQVGATGLNTLPTYFLGGDIGGESPNGIQITINDSNTTYSYIRVVALYYSSQGAVPEVTIIYEGAKNSNMIITHTGAELLGTISAEDAIASPNIITPKTVTSKYNYLFVGNVSEELFDTDFDARAYNFNSSGICRMYSVDTDYSTNYREFTKPTILYGLSITSDNGTVTKVPDKTSYVDGESVVLTATPNYQYSFTKFTTNGTDSTDNPLTLVMDSEKTVVTTYTYLTPSYSLTLSYSNGSVSITPLESLYYYNQYVTLVATANVGYSFSKWVKNGVDYTGSTLGIFMTDNTTVEAVFTIGVPTIVTSSVSSILTNKATCGGNVTSEGSSPVTEKGLCWNTTGSPTIANSSVYGGLGAGSFTRDVTGLIPSTTYYVRAYAKYLGGVVYGNEQSFSTVAETIAPSLNYLSFSPWGYPCTVRKFNVTANASGWTMDAPGGWIVFVDPADGYDHNGPLGTVQIEIGIDTDTFPPISGGRDGSINFYNTSDVLVSQVNIRHLGTGESC